MPDAATARREARQRRILENAHDRLQRIAGKNASNNTSRGASPMLVEPPSIDDKPSELPTSFLLSAPVSGPAPQAEQLEGIAHSAPELTEFLRNLSATQSSPSAAPSPPTVLDKLFITKLDIILISLLVQITYSALWMSTESPSIFLPLMVYELTKMWWWRRQEGAGVVSAMLIMNGVAPRKVQSIMLITQSLFTFIQDVCVYLFFTVFVQSLYICFLKKVILS